MIRVNASLLIVLCGLLVGCSLPRHDWPTVRPSELINLIEGPARGDLADSDFADEVTDLLPGAGLAAPAKLLFAGDVGHLRIAIGASESAGKAAYLAAARGATAREMTGELAAKPVIRQLGPLLRLAFLTGSGPVTEAGIALAPPGCAVHRGVAQI